MQNLIRYLLLAAFLAAADAPAQDAGDGFRYAVFDTGDALG